MYFKIQHLSILIALFFGQVFLFSGKAAAQELNCSVSVNDRQISGSSYDYISELQGAIQSYLNEHRWTDDRYEEHERILCSIQIVLTDVDSQFNFTAETVITVRRPIYNTFQHSSAVVISDNNWRFNYPRNKNLIHDELQFDDLSSFLDFYAYVILGFDYDSFSELGGSRYFNRALNIFELGQNSGATGWGRSIGAQRNRFGLINDLNSSAYQDLRIAYYKYHRFGLDQFTLDPDLSQSEVIQALDIIRENKRMTSNNYLFDIFFDTKYTEIVALLRDADVQTRNMAYNILRDVDPAHTSEYERLQN
jgi:hypothetical protein